ncbi:MAG: hypothetical protein NC318_06585 [Blautia sp.]|nr:hypothetical protein [Lachnoclostridium sp.]MCM1211252.1 hypothetical protein [Blautia sp.]
MTYKKTWLSYCLWAVFTCITGVMLANYAILFWKREINAGVGYDTIGFVFFIFAMVPGCFFLIRKGILEAAKKYQVSAHTAFLWEIFITLSAFMAGIVYRIYLCIQYSGRVQETEYYRLAMVRESGETAAMVHGISHLYIKCLSLVLSFLGNKVMAAVWMQIFIQMLAILLAYFAVRKLAGRLPACVVILTLSLSSVYAKQIVSITPEGFFFAFYAAGLLLIGSYLKGYCHSRFQKKTALIGALFLGLMIGALLYLDALSITLFIMAAGVILGIHKQEGKKQLPTARFSVLLYGLMLFGSLVMLAFLFVSDASLSGAKVTTIAGAWLNLYRTHFSIDYVLFMTENSMVESSMIESFLLVLFTAFFVMAFWVHKKTQNATPWIVLMLILAPTPLTKVGVLPYQVYSVFIWSVLAGIGLQQSFAAKEEPDFAAGKEQAALETFFAAGKEQTVLETSQPMEQQADTVSVAAVEDTEAKTGTKPRFLENPLPLPKKHEKKEMDYQYKVTEEQMKFDIDVREDDDFEIS